MVGPEEEGVLEVADGVADEEEKEEWKGEESKGGEEEDEKSPVSRILCNL